MTNTPQPNSLESDTGKPFSQMTGVEKLRFLGKVCVMLISGGFVYPNVFVE